MNLIHYFKQSSYHAFFLTITALFSRGLLFLFLPYFLSKLTLAEFGIWDFYQHFLSLGTMLVSSGATMALTRFYIFYKHDPLQQKTTIGNACLTVIAITLGMCSALGLGLWFFPGHRAHTLISCVIITALFSFFFVVLAYLRVVEHLGYYALVFCVQSAVALGLSVLGLQWGYGIDALFYAYGISLVLFLPLFCCIAYQHKHYSWALFKEQVHYSAPLLVYNIVSLGFFTFDRLYLASISHESLGLYALLWKFGALYQFCALSVTNALPIVIFNAHQEHEGNPAIKTLVTYASILLLLGSIISMYATRYALARWFPTYPEAQAYVPPFFMFLGILEVAKLMQTGFHLALKTLYIPLIALMMLGIQMTLFKVSCQYGIIGICYANILVFVLYAVVSCVLGYRIFQQHIVDYQQLSWVLGVFLFTTVSLMVVPVNPLMVFGLWCCLLWLVLLRPMRFREFVYTMTPVTVHEHSYSNGVTQKRVAILGPYPPPLGGIAVHVQRVGFKLQQQNNSVDFFDTEQRCFVFLYFLRLLRFLCQPRYELVYYHTPYSRRGVFELCFLVLWQKIAHIKLIFVEHDAQQFKKNTGFRCLLFSWAIRRVHHVVFIGNTPYESYQRCGLIFQHFSVESAFLPPDIRQESRILATYPQNLFEFIANHNPVILANAFQVRFVNGIDVYGYDMCRELIDRLQQTYPRVGLVFALACVGDSGLNLYDNVYVLHGQKELWPLYKRIDIFVRPTLFDNYGISVAEALFFNIPAVASDVCIRPQGTTLFSKRDQDDFYKKVCAVLPGSFVHNNSIQGSQRHP